MQAYELTVENRTQHIIKFHIKYFGQTGFSCRPDKEVVDPESISGVIRAGVCSVLSVRAWVGLRMIKARSYIPPVGRAGNTTFVVSEHGRGFKVTRDKYRSRFKTKWIDPKVDY